MNIGFYHTDSITLKLLGYLPQIFLKTYENSPTLWEALLCLSLYASPPLSSPTGGGNHPGVSMRVAGE